MNRISRMGIFQLAFLMASLMLVGITGMAQAETKLKQLGQNPFYQTELKSVAEFQQMVSVTLPDLKDGFAKAGAADLFDDFVTQAGRSENIRPIEVNPGEKLQWMIYKKGETVKVVKDVVWVGKESFSAFLLHVDKAGVRYTFVVPAICGNVSLALTGPQPAVAQEPVPAVAPYCQVTVSPLDVAIGEDVTIDASLSAAPGGTISSVLIEITDANNAVVKKRITEPPFIYQMTMNEPGDYTVQVSVTDDRGQESSSPGCEATKITVASPKATTVVPHRGNLVADIGYMYQTDPAEYLLFRIGYDYYLNEDFSLLGMVGVAPVVDGKDDTDSWMVDFTANYHQLKMFYGIGVGFWSSSTDDRLDFIFNLGYRIYGEADQFNISLFAEARAAFDQFDELNEYGRLGGGLRFQF